MNSAMSSIVSVASTADGESLTERHKKLREAAKRQRMSEIYPSSAVIDDVTGPLYFAKVLIEGTPVDGMVDPGSSATINLFKETRGAEGSPHFEQCTGKATCHIEGL